MFLIFLMLYLRLCSFEAPGRKGIQTFLMKQLPNRAINLLAIIGTVSSRYLRNNQWSACILKGETSKFHCHMSTSQFTAGAWQTIWTTAIITTTYQSNTLDAIPATQFGFKTLTIGRPASILDRVQINTNVYNFWTANLPSFRRTGVVSFADDRLIIESRVQQHGIPNKLNKDKQFFAIFAKNL